jgi:Pentapeptide repeats (9 copies)
VGVLTKTSAALWSVGCPRPEGRRRGVRLDVRVAVRLGAETLLVSGGQDVRMAGLYALERLGGSNRQLRQTVVNLICAYLRMPYCHVTAGSSPEDSSPEALVNYRERLQEREVRMAAQQILISKLVKFPESVFGNRHWDLMAVDLNGTVLEDFKCDDTSMREARFDGTTFVGAAEFSRSHFQVRASFDNACFAGTVRFFHTNIDRVSFKSTQFTQDEPVDFQNAISGPSTRISEPSHRSPRSSETPAAESATRATKGAISSPHARHRQGENSARQTKRTTPSSRSCGHPSSDSSRISSPGESSTPTTVVRIAPTVTHTTPLVGCSSSQLHGILKGFE